MAKEMNQKHNIAVQLIVYELVWFLSIYAAAENKLNLALFCLGVGIIVQLVVDTIVAHRLSTLIKFTLLFVVLGCTIDSLLIAFQIFSYQGMFYKNVIPPFLLGIWISFAIMFYAVFKDWFAHFIILGLIASVGFPAAYWFGIQLGAGEAQLGTVSYVILGGIWLVLLPMFLYGYLHITESKS